ncbi:MAG TPA: helix-turn-helix transcriptional regulator [Steroidobacteraceae bacterium]|jgi:transcriptional regulator with XRE-family HTH domain|nr:helix-turn-helix transcriptional regulator [Steroidobacteraceae bacterium]
MTSRAVTATSPGTELGDLLRQWRGRRGKSQSELSLDTGISQRHISFVESGKSAPSRDTLIVMAEALDVPLRDRNALLLAAGYAPLYSDRGWDAAEMDGLKRAIQRMLQQHEPYPAVVMDRYWNVLMANEAAPRFFGAFIDMSARPAPRNLLHLMFDPQGMRPFLEGWDSLARGLVQRVHRESIGRVVDGRTRELLAVLMAYPDVRPEWRNAATADISPLSPVIGYRFRWRGATLNYFSMVTTVGSPAAVAAQELRIECMFPSDDATERRHLQLLESSRDRVL